MIWFSVQLKSPIISLWLLFPMFIIVWAFSQNSGVSFDGAYTASASRVLRSGNVIVKKRVSLLPWLFMFVILQPLFFFKRTNMPLCFEGLP